MKKNKEKLNLQRLSEILTVLKEEGFDFIVSKLHLNKCVSWRCRLSCFLGRTACAVHLKKRDPPAVRIRRVLERLGTTFVKIGQILSLRGDFLPRELCDELQKLQSRAPFFAMDEVKKTIESEFGKPIEEVFSDFDEEPLAAASIAQVHAAVLADGERVIVKVQRPGVDARVRADLEIILWMARNIEKYIPKLRVYNPYRNAREFAEYTTKELDFRNEAKITQKFHQVITRHEHMYAPRVYLDYCAPQVLVLERIAGREIYPVETLEEDGFSRIEISRRLANCLIQQMFTEGVFHADPHPGNIILMTDRRICFIDFGMYGEVDAYLQRKILRLLRFISDRQTAPAARTLISMTAAEEGADYDGYYGELLEIFDKWLGSSLNEMSMAQVVMSEIQLGGRFGFSFPKGLVLMIKALITIESICAVLSPEIRFADELKSILNHVMQKKIEWGAFVRELEDVLPDVLALTGALPDGIDAVLDKIQKRDKPGKIPQGATGPAPLALGLLCGSLIIGGAVLFAGGFHILAGAIAGPSLIVSLIQWFALRGKNRR